MAFLIRRSQDKAVERGNRDSRIMITWMPIKNANVPENDAIRHMIRLASRNITAIERRDKTAMTINDVAIYRTTRSYRKAIKIQDNRREISKEGIDRSCVISARRSSTTHVL